MFDKKIRQIAENVNKAKDEARAQAAATGKSFEELGQAITKEGKEKIKEALDELEKISPALAEIAKQRLPDLAMLDSTGAVGSMVLQLRTMEEILDENISKWQ